MRPGADHRAADVVAVHHRQVAVEDHHVVVVDAEPLQRGVAVVGDVDRSASRRSPSAIASASSRSSSTTSTRTLAMVPDQRIRPP